MNRIGRLPGHVAESMMREVRDAQRQSKAPQFTGGSSAVFYASESEQTYDWTGRLDRQVQAVGTGGAEFRITLEAKTVEYSLMDIIIEFYISDNGSEWRRYLFDDSRIYNTWVDSADRLDESQPKRMSYLAGVIGQFNTRVALKVVGIGNDDLSIGIERVF